jgi:hypothetical protein
VLLFLLTLSEDLRRELHFESLDRSVQLLANLLQVTSPLSLLIASY